MSYAVPRQIHPSSITPPPDTTNAMSYCFSIHSKARYLNNLGPNATEDKFRGIYNTIFWYWFPANRGYIIGNHPLAKRGESKSLMVRHGGLPDPILIVKVEAPSEWTEIGRQTVMDELADQIKEGFDHTQYKTIYGLGGIGLHWVVCKMESGDDQPTIVLDWQDDVSSDASYARFEIIADLVYNIASG